MARWYSGNREVITLTTAPTRHVHPMRSFVNDRSLAYQLSLVPPVLVTRQAILHVLFVVKAFVT